MNNQHLTVLRTEAVAALQIQPERWYLDATFGGGGHTAAILSQGGKVIAFDWDQQAIADGEEKFATAIKAGKLILIRESFSKVDTEITALLEAQKISPIDGALFDFGTSTEQLTSSDRGFSFEGEGKLDMRMDTRLGVTAADILQAIPEAQLARLFFDYGGETESRKIAKAIKNSPEPIITTGQLSRLIEKVKGGRRGKLHPATKVFQALRIAVNSELEEIEAALPQTLKLLPSKGRIVTIAFHEGEDRLAKRAFKQWEQDNLGQMLKLITPSTEEVAQNPRSRSAKMRIFEKN